MRIRRQDNKSQVEGTALMNNWKYKMQQQWLSRIYCLRNVRFTTEKSVPYWLPEVVPSMPFTLAHLLPISCAVSQFWRVSSHIRVSYLKLDSQWSLKRAELVKRWETECQTSFKNWLKSQDLVITFPKYSAME